MAMFYKRFCGTFWNVSSKNQILKESFFVFVVLIFLSPRKNWPGLAAWLPGCLAAWVSGALRGPRRLEREAPDSLQMDCSIYKGTPY